MSEGLSESSEMCDVVFPREKEEEIIALLTEEGSGIEAGKEPQKLTLQLIPMKLNPTPNAKTTYCPLPVYILPTPAENPKPTSPAPKTHASPSLLVKNIRKLMATGRAFSTTSKIRAAAYIAWHSGWFECRFGVGAPEPRHF